MTINFYYRRTERNIESFYLKKLIQISTSASDSSFRVYRTQLYIDIISLGALSEKFI